MATTATKITTLADVLRRLGNVPPERIHWNPVPGTATEADYRELVRRAPKTFVELVRGTFVEKAMGFPQAILATIIASRIWAYLQNHPIGIVAGADALMRLYPNCIRLPDVCFISRANLPKPDAHLQQIAEFAPDLAIEILSPGNTPKEMAIKRRDFFQAGTQFFWLVNLKNETITVYSDPKSKVVYTKTDTLDGDPILPGFTLKLEDLFNDQQLLAQ